MARGRVLGGALGGVTVVLLASGILAGCGGGPTTDDGGLAVPERLGGDSIRVADCADWRDITPRERFDVVALLHDFYGTPIGPGDGGPQAPGPTLDDDDAYDLLEGQCAASYASAFKLYKLYGRAAGFAAP